MSVLLLLLLLAWSAASSKLNVPRVLLPYSEEGADFILSSDDRAGCFKWKSSRPEVVSVTPLDEDSSRGCAGSARVSAKSLSWHKSQAVVTAEDINSQLTLRCDVIVDVIHSLQIVTKTHELFLEEAPEEFSVRAYDEQKNEFTTVQKIIFKWSIENIVKSSSGPSEENIRFINFRDSSYAIEKSLQEIEAVGKQGRKVLLEGIKTGSSKVSVRLSAASYAKVPAAEVNLMVVANLYLVPGSVYLMPGTNVDFHAEQIKSNKVHEIILPSPQYFLKVEDEKFAKLKEGSSCVTGVSLGSTEVTLRDTNVAPDDLVKSPVADVHVVSPASIALSVNPHKNWNVIVGRSYEILVDIFDKDNNRIYPSENVVVKVDIPQSYFRTTFSSPNGTVHFGNPIKVGDAEVKASLVGLRDEKGTLVELERHLQITGVLHIFDEIQLRPALSVLPWDPVTKPVFSVNFDVHPASSSEVSYLWSSSDPTLSSVTQNGVAKTQTEAGRGHTIIRAAMSRASHNYGEARIVVLPAAGITFLDYVLEAEVGKNLALPLSFFGIHEGSRITFTQCHLLPLDVSVSDTKTFEASGEQFEISKIKDLLHADLIDMKACTALDLKAKAPGFSIIKAGYSFRASEGKAIKTIQDDITVSAFDPLSPVQPVSGDALMALESSMQVVWSGGPLPWLGRPEGHFHKLDVSDPDIVRTSSPHTRQERTPPNIFVYDVQCLRLGEVELTLSVGNVKSKTLPQPMVAKSTVKVVCREPDQIVLSGEIPPPVGTVKPCPLDSKIGRVAALASEDLVIKVTVLDSNGRPFNSINSLEVDWRLSDNDKGKLLKETGVDYPRNEHGLDYQPLEDAQNVLLAGGRPGSLDVTATLRRSSGILGFGTVEGSLHLNLVSEASVYPAVMSVFNHPHNKEFAQIRDGSGYFELSNGNPSVAESVLVSNNHSVAVKPVSDGDLMVQVRDLCLRAKTPVLRVQVSGVHKVELLASDKVQKLNSVKARVSLLDRQGKRLPQSALRFVQVSLIPAVGIVRVTPLASEDEGDVSDVSFSVKGLDLGETKIVATANFGTNKVNSQPASIQVFPPLEIEPRNVTLVIGDRFQVRTTGGPRPDCAVEFSLANTKISESSPEGLLKALTLGSTKMYAKAVGVDKITDKKISYSEDEITVHVVKLTGIRIRAPLLHLRTGTEMPLNAFGTDQHQNPFAFGTAVPNIQLQWSATKSDAGDLVSVFHQNGVEAAPVNEVAMRFVAKKPGRVQITLVAKITQSLQSTGQFQLDRDKQFQDQIVIEVFEDLSLRHPHLPRNTLLMSPHSSFQLVTTKDKSASNIKFTVITKEKSVAPVIASKTGLLTAGGDLGSADVLIEEEEEFGGTVQRMSVVVEVKPVQYIMINAKQIFAPSVGSTPLQHLPKGLNLPLQISYHDDTGARFDVTDMDASYRPSRFDSLVMTEEANNSLSAELVSEERTVLRVWAKDELQDFIVLHVARGIAPSLSRANKLLVGEVLRLDNLIEPTADEAIWIVEPREMASLNMKTGLATLLRSGPVRFSYLLLESEQRTSLDLEVVIPSGLAISRPEIMTGKAGNQFVPFLIKSELGNETSNYYAVDYNEDAEEILDASMLFRCQARFASQENRLEDFFTVKAVFNTKMRSHACQFSPEAGLFQAKAALLADEIQLEILPTFASRQSLPSAKTSFKFLPGFYVLTKEVKLSNVEPSSQVEVQGLPHVLESIKVEASHEEFIQIGRSYLEGESSKVVPVHLRSAFWSQEAESVREEKQGILYLQLSSSLASQTSTVAVRVSFSADSCSLDELGWSSLLYLLLAHYQALVVVAISCAVCVVATKFILSKSAAKGPMQQQQQGSISMKTPLAVNSPLAATSPFAAPAGGSPQQPLQHLTNSDQKPYLWTADSDNSPIYGSPPTRRRPTGSPRSLTQFSYASM